MKNITKTILIQFLFGVILTTLVFGIFLLLFKGNSQSFKTTVDHKTTEVGSQFESSNTNSRYALTESIAERGAFFFTLEQARFAAPDMVYHNGQFFTIFTPGISMFAVPMYKVGQLLGNIQHLTTFITTVIFAVINLILIAKLSRKMGASTPASWVAGLVFALATNALSYTFTLTQHHGSVAIILLCLLNAMSEKRTLVNNLIFGALCGIGLLFDFPNLFMVTPIGLYILNKHFSFEESKTKISMQIKSVCIAIGVGFFPVLALFMWYNSVVTGSPFMLGQMFMRSDYFDTPEQQELNRRRTEITDPFSDKLPFSTRTQIHSFYTLLLSDERAWIYYSPVILIGFIGIMKAYQQQHLRSMTVLMTTILALNILIYGMFGDPWGGWSFGPRYLIPGAAILAIFIGIAIQFYAKNILFTVIFCVLTVYSVRVSFAGALTTNSIPPRVEAEHLSTGIPHTYQYNFQKLALNESSSLVFNLVSKEYMTAYQYWQLQVLFATMLIGSTYLWQLATVTSFAEIKTKFGKVPMLHHRKHAQAAKSRRSK